MRPLPVKTQTAILRALLRNWQRACGSPRVCKMLILQHRFFTNEKIRVAVHALLISAGDWMKAKAELKNSPLDCDKLFAWAEKIQG